MGKFYNFLCRNKRINQTSGAILCVTGDRELPLMDALLCLNEEHPEMLDGLIEVIPVKDARLHFAELRQFRPPYMKALGDISQFLQDNGYEDASRFLNGSFEV